MWQNHLKYKLKNVLKGVSLPAQLLLQQSLSSDPTGILSSSFIT